MKSFEKLQKIAIWLLVVLLPSQLGWHFWPKWAFVDGIRVDYLSPTLYATDFLIGAIFIFELMKLAGAGFKIFSKTNKAKLLLGTLFISANFLFSISPAITFYKWIKFLELLFLGILVIKNTPRILLRRTVSYGLGIGVLYSSILAIWQFVIQQSVGGWWYFLGERTFSPTTAGIANAFFSGQLVLRPYATFSHPNVLAGFLGVSALFISAVFIREKCVKKSKLSRYFLFLSLVLVLGQIALFISLSRSAIIFYLFSLLILILRKVKKSRRKVIVGGFFLIGVMVIGQRIFNVGIETEPIVVRIQFIVTSWKNFLRAPILGTGFGTAPLLSNINVLPYALRFQPPHSIFLVMLLETGILGTCMFTLGVFSFFRTAWEKFKHSETLPFVLLIFLLLTGIGDHYWLTSIQGNLTIFLIGGMVLFSSTS